METTGGLNRRLFFCFSRGRTPGDPPCNNSYGGTVKTVPYEVRVASNVSTHLVNDEIAGGARNDGGGRDGGRFVNRPYGFVIALFPHISLREVTGFDSMIRQVFYSI